MIGQVWGDLLTAVEFLTRVPVPPRRFEEASLARSVRYFPLVGLGIGTAAGWLDRGLSGHAGRWVAAVLTVGFLLLVTGCLHEDGLADAADGFGGGRTPERVMAIFRDSRIGTYGAAALGMSLIGRTVLLATMPTERVVPYVVAAEVLSRWTALPLGYWLPAARADGEGGQVAGLGVRVAGRTTGVSVGVGSVVAVGIVGAVSGVRAVGPFLVAAMVALGTGWYYRRRIGGVTGDCFGATVAVTEMAVMVCGVWQP